MSRGRFFWARRGLFGRLIPRLVPRETPGQSYWLAGSGVDNPVMNLVVADAAFNGIEEKCHAFF